MQHWGRMVRRGTCSCCLAIALLSLMHLGLVGSGPLKWASSLMSKFGSTTRLRSSAIDTGPPTVPPRTDDGAAGKDSARTAPSLQHSRHLQQFEAPPPPSVPEPQATDVDPMQGSVYGSTKISVIGRNFVPDGNYSLTFSSVNFDKTSTTWELESSSCVFDETFNTNLCNILIFLTPLWGTSFDSLYGVVETDVALFSHLQPVYKDNETAPLKFLYTPSWEPGSFGPTTTGSVLGGTGTKF